ncbi:sperm flagellar protein 1-like isoform X2 [Tubulanus polymorphus]|uniref:sperm flagellar protein 1-like isoform X2 n=1 Tax=Tubulanus polymorphus TaxID=672921 RepID=UPI003DA5AA42
MEDLDDDELKDLYSWVDEIPLSRPKRNMTRDFSDGVLVAEMIKHYFPRLVELHNYVPANATKQKEENWHLLNRKVLRKLHIELSEDVIRSIALSRPMVIEKVLTHLREKIKKKTESSGYVSDRPEVDQSSPKGYNHHHQQESYPSHQKAGGGGKQARSSHQLPPAPPPVAPPQPHPLTPQTSTRETYFTRYTYTPGSPSDINSLCQQSDDLLDFDPQFDYQDSKLAAASDGGKQYSSDAVPRIDYEEKVQECLAKDEAVQILQAKIRRLEHLLHLKDTRIENLQTKLEQLRPSGNRR